MIWDIPNGCKLVLTILKKSLVYGIALEKLRAIRSLRTIDRFFLVFINSVWWKSNRKVARFCNRTFRERFLLMFWFVKINAVMFEKIKSQRFLRPLLNKRKMANHKSPSPSKKATKKRSYYKLKQISKHTDTTELVMTIYLRFIFAYMIEYSPFVIQTLYQSLLNWKVRRTTT